MNGTATLVFTWTHGAGQDDDNDPAPTTVIACETAIAGWTELDGSYSVGDDASTGMADEYYVPDEMYIYTLGLEHAYSGRKYELLGVSGTGEGATVTVTSPTLRASLTDDGTRDNIGGRVQVVFDAALTNLQITLDPPVIGSPGSYKCLVGQQVTAHLSITPDPDENSDGSPAYHWNVYGGEPFGSYEAS